MKKSCKMKNLFIWIIALYSLISCDTQNMATNPEELKNLLSSDQFTFMAERANPTNYDVINVINSMPNATATRMLNLQPGYTIVLADHKLEVDLPYFGRVYNPSMDPQKSGIKVSSKDFSINKTQNKKGNWTYQIQPKDGGNVSNIYIEIYKSGKAFVSVDSNDRQPITYDGNIMKNEEPKK